MRNVTWIAVVVLALAAVGSSLADGPRPTPFQMTVEDGRVSLRANNVRLVEVLQELSARFDFEVLADESEDSRVNVNFEDLSVDQAVRRLCEDVGYLVVRDVESYDIQRLLLTPRSTTYSVLASSRPDTQSRRTTKRDAARTQRPPQQAPDATQQPAGGSQAAAAKKPDSSATTPPPNTDATAPRRPVRKKGRWPN